MKVLHAKIKESVNYREFGFHPIGAAGIAAEITTQVLTAASIVHLQLHQCFYRQPTHNSLEILVPGVKLTSQIRQDAMSVDGVEACGSISLTGADTGLLITLSA
jgi:hypothetical protein